MRRTSLRKARQKHGRALLQSDLPRFLDGKDWLNVPDTLKEGLRATLLRDVIEDSVGSVVNGKYDSCDGSHMSWTTMILDEQAVAEISLMLERMVKEVIAIQESTKERLGSNNAMGISYTVSILGHPSLGGEKRVGPPTDAEELAESTERKQEK